MTLSIDGDKVWELNFTLFDEESIGGDDRRIVVRLHEIYQAVIVANEEQEKSIETYKNIDVPLFRMTSIERIGPARKQMSL